MRILFDLGHPAHVHLFRNLSQKVVQHGGEILAATREKDVTIRLCDAYRIPQVVLSRAYSGSFTSGIKELVQRTFRLWLLALKFKPDALLGTSFSIGMVGKAILRPSFVFEEDDASIIPLFARFVYPTCTYVVTPDCLKHENHGRKHLTYPGFHELAYLHPDHFTPNPDVPRSMGLDIDKPYFMLRFVSLKAFHDVGAEGLSTEAVRKLVEMLSQKGRVIITAEGNLLDEFRKYQFPLPPEKFQDVLAFASMYIGDSQTVTIEASMLGIPSIRCNTFVGIITCIEDLEHKYGLTRGFLPGQSAELISIVEKWLHDLEGLKKEYMQRRNDMLSRCVNLTDWMWSMLSEKVKVN